MLKSFILVLSIIGLISISAPTYSKGAVAARSSARVYSYTHKTPTSKTNISKNSIKNTQPKYLPYTPINNNYNIDNKDDINP